MSSEQAETLIVGAGPTGLGAAWRLATVDNHDWCLCEATHTFGGLAGSIVDADGFTWDLGGHVQHSHYPYFDVLMDDLLGADGWVTHRRESWIWIAGRFVPYPFQLNVHRLPGIERDECLRGLRDVAARPRPHPASNFGEWIDLTFGRGIAQLFMRPYNVKVWSVPLEEMDWRWVGDRVPIASLERALESGRLGRDDDSWGPNSQFRFPRRGGTGAVWRTLGQRLVGTHPDSVHLGHRLTALDPTRRVAYFDTGRSIRYDRLLTTIPLDELLNASDCFDRLRIPARELRHTPVHVLGIALLGSPPEAIAGKCWMYFPETECPFHRMTLFSLYSPFNVPDQSQYWSLLVESSEAPGRPPGPSLIERTVASLIADGVIQSLEQVHHVWHARLEHGYPVPTLCRDAALDAILPALETMDIYSRGRFGAWKYEVSNQDHSFAQGVEVVDRWLTGSTERTLSDPDGVNIRR